MSAIFLHPIDPASSAGACLDQFSRHPDICPHCDAEYPEIKHPSENNPLCSACGCRYRDIRYYYLVTSDQHLASPMFASKRLLEQFAEFFAIPKGTRYSIQEIVQFFSSSRSNEREALIGELDRNKKLLDKLLALPSEAKHSAELPYVATAAGLFGYALPQFDEGYGEELD